MILQNGKEVHKKYVFHSNRKTVYNKYIVFLKSLNLSEDTIDWRLKHIRGFLDYIDKKNILIKNITPLILYNYINSINHLSLRTIENRTVCLRLFFDWLSENKYNKYPGKLIFPKIVRNKNCAILTYYTNKEISQLINSVDNTTVNGKRDLLIILMFSCLGIRLKDIKYLKLENIDFQNNIIKIIQHKTDSLLVLPLLPDIKYALLDYLKNKGTNTEYLITDDSGNIYSSDKIYLIVKNQFIKSRIKIKGRKMGPHALRHSLATSLINNNVSIYDVSQVLGHDNVESTKNYTKIDIKRLKKLSLEVPKWQS